MYFKESWPLAAIEHYSDWANVSSRQASWALWLLLLWSWALLFSVGETLLFSRYSHSQHSLFTLIIAVIIVELLMSHRMWSYCSICSRWSHCFVFTLMRTCDMTMLPIFLKKMLVYLRERRDVGFFQSMAGLMLTCRWVIAKTKEKSVRFDKTPQTCSFVPVCARVCVRACVCAFLLSAFWIWMHLRGRTKQKD